MSISIQCNDNDETSRKVHSAVEDSVVLPKIEYSHERLDNFDRGKGGFMTAYINVVCVVAGTGTLGLPKAFAQGGWLSILVVILVYMMSVYSSIILIRCLYYKPGRRLHDFKAVGTAAFGQSGYVVASVLHLLSLFGGPALYLVLASSNMHQLFIDTTAGLTQPIWAVIIGVLLLVPALLQKTLREVTATSAVAALCTVIAVCVVMIQAPQDHRSDVVHDSVVWTGFPTALSTIAFAFGGINTYPHIEHALRNPHQWKYASTAGLTTCAVLYFLTAIPGYWTYGRDAQSPIYDSLGPGAGRMTAIIVMTIHVVLAIPISTTSFSLEFERFAKISEERLGKTRAWLGRAAVRILTMGILIVLAVFVPYFSDFMSLIGALSTCGLVFLLPVSFYIKLTGWQNKSIVELAFCAFTIFLGVVGCVFGTIDAIRALTSDFQT
ncbi:transmembrane amino acid transporter protein-domain-containing protein [Dichotomocladium elegans]|nr:transmembrane amino acid transporter protein-domain-containing protein [Dichotomocladium elegans]